MVAYLWEKQIAQENLLSAMQTAFDRLEYEAMTDFDRAAMKKTMSKQMARVEKLFGFDPHSFSRGC